MTKIDFERRELGPDSLLPDYEPALMDIPKCEVCGECDVSVQTQDVGMCDDCAADAIRGALKPLFGKICGNVSRQDNGWLQTCLAAYGVEHEH